MFAKQKPGGWWVHEENLYRPKYLSTNWMLLILSDLGLTKEDPRIQRAAELWRDRFSKADGGFGSDGANRSHLCIVGNTARALIKFGYADDPKVKSALEWLVKDQASNGGWSCFGSRREPRLVGGDERVRGLSQADVDEEHQERRGEGGGVLPAKVDGPAGGALRALVPVPLPRPLLLRPARGARLHDRAGLRGRQEARRGGRAAQGEERRPTARWNLDAVHPDVEGGMADWYSKHSNQAPTPFALEKAGRPSKMITLRAMLVLHRLGE